MMSRDYRVLNVAEALTFYAQAIWNSRINRQPKFVVGSHVYDDALTGETARARQLAKLVAKIGRLLPFGRNCLIQANVLHAMLKRRGISHEVHVGVQHSCVQEPFSAHAWVSVEHLAVLGESERSFVELARPTRIHL